MSHATKNAIVKIGASIENAIFNKKPSNDKSENRDHNQIAGHDADEFGRRRLFFENDEVFKLYEPDESRGRQEFLFYVDYYNSDENSFIRNTFSDVIPTYRRSEKRKDKFASKVGNYIVIENIFTELQNHGDCCLADIKIGAPITKYDREGAKFLGLDNSVLKGIAKKAYTDIATPELIRVGYQVLGIKIKKRVADSDPDSNQWTWKKYGKSLGRTANSIGNDFIVEKFLAGADSKGPNGSDYRRLVVESLILELERIKKFLETQTRYQFFGSSLVLAYLPPDDACIPELLKSISEERIKNEETKKTKTEEICNIPMAGVFEESLTSTLPNEAFRTPDRFVQQIPLAGKNYTKRQKTAVVRLIDFNNVVIGSDKIDQESLNGVDNLIKHLKASQK